MKKIVYFATIILLCVLIFVVYRVTRPRDFGSDVPLTEFMLGKWKASQQVTDFFGTHLEEYQVAFMSQSGLEFCIWRPDEPFCAGFTYQLIDENKFKVENERDKGNEWAISRVGDNLLICRKYGNCLLYTRDNTWWPTIELYYFRPWNY
jgi:hypothetical protein